MTENNPLFPAASGNGPGRLIRAARDTAKLSLEDLAAVIKLPRHTVDALERDDFATLKEPVYVRGYYRKLAKVLPVSEEELVAAYRAVAQPRSIAAPSKLILAGNQELGGGAPLNKALIGVGMVVTALVLALAAFWATRSMESASEPEAVPQVQSVAPAPAAAAPVAATAPDAAASNPATAPAPAPTAVPTPATAVEAPTSGSSEAPPAPAAAAAIVAAASAPVAAVPGEAELQIDASKDCWIRIEDADGKKLISSIVAGGEKLSIKGKAPFAIAIGHVPGVQIRFNGTLVDMSSFVRSNGSARFSLP